MTSHNYTIHDVTKGVLSCLMCLSSLACLDASVDFRAAECADSRPSARVADCGQSARGCRQASELASNQRRAIGAEKSAKGRDGAQSAEVRTRRCVEFMTLVYPGVIPPTVASEPPGDSVSHPEGFFFVGVDGR